jgi:hypothetical protein
MLSLLDKNREEKLFYHNISPTCTMCVLQITGKNENNSNLPSINVRSGNIYSLSERKRR